MQPFYVITLTNKQRLEGGGQEVPTSRPTLQVRERVQGRLVSGSWTPQCLLGSNTLPVKQETDSADSTQPILPFLPGSSQGGGSPGTQRASFVSFPQPLSFDGRHTLGSGRLSAAAFLTPSW